MGRDPNRGIGDHGGDILLHRAAESFGVVLSMVKDLFSDQSPQACASG
jgi:hypothetical protein